MAADATYILLHVNSFFYFHFISPHYQLYAAIEFICFWSKWSFFLFFFVVNILEIFQLHCVLSNAFKLTFQQRVITFLKIVADALNVCHVIA